MPAKGATTSRGEQSKARILAAAIGLFCERGISATSVSQICGRAEVAKTALYHHFGNKEGLIVAAMEDMSGGWVLGIQGQVQIAGTPAERLDALLAGLRTMIEEHDYLLRFFEALMFEQGSVGKELAPVRRDVYMRSVDALVDGFESALGTTLPNTDLLARLILWTLYGVHREVQMSGSKVDLDRTFAWIRNLLSMVALDMASQAATEAIAQRAAQAAKKD